MNPILYTLAQKSPGTYFNDVTTGNNDYNAANSAAVQREQRVRHGDGIGDAHHVGPGDGPHGDPARSRGLGLPEVRRDPYLHRDSQLRGIEHHAVRRHV